MAHNLAVVSLQTSYAGQGERLAALLWSAGQMMFTKYVVLVDGTVNAHSAAQVLYAIAEHAHCRDRFLLSRGPVDALDHSAKESGVGAKLLINAMGASVSSEAELRSETLTIGSPGLALHVGDTFLAAVFAVPTQETIHWEALLESLRGAYHDQPRFAVLVDAKAPWRDPSRLMWSILANTDPSRDIGFHAIEGSGRLQLRVDARMKLKPSESVQRWPNPVVSDSATQARIDALWAGLGLGPLILSPSSQLQEFRFGEGAQARYEV